ncbi:MAG: lamin tail domain-containing protein [Polyangiaceae bacterium]|nr:lamin tail domain-containing protein [Polyangiaceae bacterium]
MRLASLALLGSTVLPSCGGDPDPRPPPAPLVVVEAVPLLLGHPVPTSQLLVRGEIDPATVALVRGEVSDAALSALASGSLPTSVRSRSLPIDVERVEAGLVVRPRAPLTEERHTLAVGAPRARATLDVVSGPPEAVIALAGPDDVVACVDAPEDALIAVGAAPSRVTPGARGVEDDRCFTVSRPLPSALARSDGALVALVPPSPPEEPRASSSRRCAPPRVALGDACVEIEDDRLVVHDATTPSLLWLDADDARLRVSIRTLPATLRGLAPSSTMGVRAVWLPPSGAPVRAELTLRTTPPRARGVLTEALADPLGPEPDAEWVEIANDGALPLDLTGWGLRDEVGASTLPSAVLAPGARALLVTPRFVASEPPPSTSCRLLVVASLGKNGLSNEGEALELVTPDGAVASRLPAVKARAGWSVSRGLDASVDAAPAVGPPTPCAP